MQSVRFLRVSTCYYERLLVFFTNNYLETNFTVILLLCRKAFRYPEMMTQGHWVRNVTFDAHVYPVLTVFSKHSLS
jgi:hypothetical protein